MKLNSVLLSLYQIFKPFIGVVLILSFILMHWQHNPPTNLSIKISGYSYALDTPLSGWDDSRLQRKKIESDFDFISRVNRQIFKSYYHCKYYNTSRYIDKLIAIGLNTKFEEVGILIPENRVCTQCHQSAYILSVALQNGGLNAKPLGLNGHVVTLVTLNEESWIVDPDFGLGPFKYKEEMLTDVGKFYERVFEGQKLYTYQYLKAYKTSFDDRPYYSMEWLAKVELQQKFICIFLS